ncbi:allophanate hydrolase subunit 2 [Microbacterium testaceum StLB037]|uniref:Allophanate hydrolase subunit 2 n=1 Tax=Microbacterium testaceum (strain StLB037) TaxID=979556 RepID=E8NE57_MICTS|nr:allophanate hydrolase subunit 2 [Microbacterium testaceum StLB037]
MAGVSPREPRVRRQRGALESLGAVVLGFESIIVFLGGLVVYGLKVLPFGIEPWWGIVGGVVMALAMVAVAGMLQRRGAVWAGWGLQVLLLLGGFLVPALSVVALIFGGMWAYATIKGAALDRQNARRAASPDLSNGE